MKMQDFLIFYATLKWTLLRNVTQSVNHWWFIDFITWRYFTLDATSYDKSKNNNHFPAKYVLFFIRHITMKQILYWPFIYQISSFRSTTNGNSQQGSNT